MIEINIPLPPCPWAAPIKGRFTFYDPREAEKRAVRFYIREQYEGEVITDYTGLEFTYIFKPPKSASKKKTALMLSGQIIPTKCDCTNLQKLYEDCLKGIVIDDDRKVARIYSQKLYGEKEEVIIRIYKHANCSR